MTVWRQSSERPSPWFPQCDVGLRHGGRGHAGTDRPCRSQGPATALAKKTGAIVASVGYRHAPEHRFPAAHDDTFAAHQWVLQNAGSFGGDPRRIAVAGESAGENPAAVSSASILPHAPRTARASA